MPPRWPKMAPNSPRQSQDGIKSPKMVLRWSRWPQNKPRRSQEDPKIHINGPRKRQNCSKMVQDSPKMGKLGQDRSKIAPRWPSAWPLLCFWFAIASLLRCFCFAFAFAFDLLLCCLCFPMCTKRPLKGLSKESLKDSSASNP